MPAQGSGVDDRDPLRRSPSVAASSPSRLRPTTTSYGSVAGGGTDLDPGGCLLRHALPSTPVRRGPPGRPPRGCDLRRSRRPRRGDFGVQTGAGRPSVRASCRARVDGEQRAGGVQADALGGRLRRRIESRPRVQRRAVARVPASSTAPPPSASTPVMLAAAARDRVPLHRPEGSSPSIDENVRDRLAVGGSTMTASVSRKRHAAAAGRAAAPIADLPSPSGRPERPRGLQPCRLPRRDRVGSGAVQVATRRLRRVSATESPPNFSATASASTSATIASATTPAAGTAQTSERWWCALAASPVLTSMVRSARGTVAIGFIAARTRSTSPVLMPPSMPPARPVVRRTPSGPSLTISSCACGPAASGPGRSRRRPRRP